MILRHSQKTLLIIPTVAGLAEVQSLTRTRPEEPNTVALPDFTKLAVSQEYDTFIRRPSGAIEQDFAHANWFMLISSRIDSGKSWQLGTYLAHALEARGALWMVPPEASETAVQDRVVVATGAIQKTGMVVHKVGQIAEKLGVALPHLAAARKAGQPALFLLPEANLADVPADLAAIYRQENIEIHGVTTVADALQLLGIEAAAASGKTWEGSPWPGLVAYGADQRRVFFGRDSARKAALQVILAAEARSIRNARRAFLLVHGPSGVGKSSFVRAGLMGDIAEQVKTRAPWESLAITFSGATDQPCQQIAQAIGLALLPDPGSASKAASELEHHPEHVSTFLETAGRGCLLLVLDQFEQALVELPHDRAQALGVFIDRLCATGKVWVIATIRSGQLELVYRIPSLSALAADARQFRLEGPDRDEIAHIVTGPALAAGISFDPMPDGSDLVQNLVAEAARSTNSLPLLQLTLSRLFGYAKDNRIGPAEFKAMGGLAGAAATSADDAVSTLRTEGISDVAINHFLAELVRIDPETGDVLARAVSVTDERSGADDRARARIARHMTDTRLLVELEDDGKPRLRLAHEALILHWPRLKDLVGKLRAEILLRDEIEAEARKWAAAGQASDHLRRSDAQVMVAKNLADEGLLPLSPEARDFVVTSVAAKRRARRNRTAAWVGAPLVIALIASIAAAYYKELSNKAATAAALAETALLDRNIRAVQTATLLSRSEAAAGRPLEGLQFLVDALEAVPEEARPPEAADALALALQKAAQISTRGQLPKSTVFIQSGNEIWAHSQAEGILWLFGPDGVPDKVGGETLRGGKLVDIQRLKKGDEVVIVWHDGLIERRSFAHGVIGMGRSYQAPPDRTDIAVNMRHAGLDADFGSRSVNRSWITPSGQVAIYQTLSPVNRFHGSSYDASLWILDTQNGRSVRPELSEGREYTIFTDEHDNVALMNFSYDDNKDVDVLEPIFPSPAAVEVTTKRDQNSKRIRNWAEILENTPATEPTYVMRPRSDVDFAGLCRSTPVPGSHLAVGKMLSEHNELLSSTTYCEAVQSGVLTIAEELNDSGAFHSLWFRTASGTAINLLKALPQYFTDISPYNETQQLRQYVTDSDTGLVALVIHDFLVVMRFEPEGTLPEIIATLSFDHDSSLITVLDAETLLIITPETGAYNVRRLTADTDAAQRVQLVDRLPYSAIPITDPLNKGNCVSLVSHPGWNNPRRPNLFESGNSFIYECLSGGGDFQVFSDYDGIAITPKGFVKPEYPEKAEFTDWITRKPASPAYVISDGSVVAYHFEDKTVRRWRKSDSAPPSSTAWSDKVVLRAADQLIYMEPDATASRILIAEMADVGYVIKLVDLASSEVMHSFGLQKSLGATFISDGTIVFAGSNPDGLDIQTYRLRTVNELMPIAVQKLFALCGATGCSADQQGG